MFMYVHIIYVHAYTCVRIMYVQALAPGSHITPHFGPSNKKLRCMLPLVVPDGSSSGPSSGGGPVSCGGAVATTTAAAAPATQQDLDGEINIRMINAVCW